LDGAANHPDVLLEEGAFAVEWGAAVQFYPENEWKNTVDLLGSITNSKVAMMSHTQLAPGQTGTDNWGTPVSFWQAFYYSIGSLLIGKSAQYNNSYLTFSSGTAYNSIVWYDEFDKIDLGAPVSPYTVTNVGGVNIYWREFALGYVAVNPTANDLASFAFPQAVKPITHDNLLSQSTIASVGSVMLKGHNAAIVLKTSVGSGGGSTGGGSADTAAPSVPAGLAATAASPSQINLAWQPSTDNVAVTGYKVYRNGSLFGIVGNVLGVQDTGLAAGTRYSYTVQAVDAAGNASAQSTAVAATTASAPVTTADTSAPSVPTGLSSSGVSAGQLTLSWKPSTDNVAVAGYRIYVNEVAIATSAGTSFAHTGLAPNTTYKYRVAAVDTAGNASALSSTLSVKTKRH
jgi:chitodextrinase